MNLCSFSFKQALMLISSVGKSLILSIFGVSHPTPRGVSQWYRLLKVKVIFNAPADKHSIACPAILQNPRKVDGFCDFTVKSFPTIGKGFRIRFEAPYYEEGVGVDGAFQNLS